MTSKDVELSGDGVVVISYHDLSSAPESLSASITRAFGDDADCLGLIIVKDLPAEYQHLRSNLLHFAAKFAALDPILQEKYSDPSSRFSFGWSHGKEIMNGKPDILKGSYYANVRTINSQTSPPTKEQKESFPEYYGENIWPDDADPKVKGFKEAFEHLGRFVLEVGYLLARACQPFVQTQLLDGRKTLLEMITNSKTTKGRLLHYFPPPKDAELDADGSVNACGYHLDHSMLTGLCSALYLAHEPGNPPQEVLSPSPLSGLYIKNRGGQVVKASFPANCLAFQTGESLELATAGKLRATPHYVKVDTSGQLGVPISRETFALFMQPETDELISEGETFGQFSARIFSKHYDTTG